VLRLDEFIELALHDRHRHADLREIRRRVIRLGLHHLADGADERLERIRRG